MDNRIHARAEDICSICILHPLPAYLHVTLEVPHEQTSSASMMCGSSARVKQMRSVHVTSTTELVEVELP